MSSDHVARLGTISSSSYHLNLGVLRAEPLAGDLMANEPEVPSTCLAVHLTYSTPVCTCSCQCSFGYPVLCLFKG